MATPIEDQKKVARCLLAGKTWIETAAETKVSKATIARLSKKQDFIDLMAQVKKENSEPEPPKVETTIEDRPAVSVDVEVVATPRGPRGCGQPSKLTPETRRILWSVIKNGGTEADACGMARIAYRTFIYWIQIAEGRLLSREPTEDYLQFLREYEIAKAERNTKLTAIIRNAAIESTVEKYDAQGKLVSKEKRSGDYKAALALLERGAGREKADILVAAEAMLSETLSVIYAAIQGSDRIPDEYKAVVFELMAAASPGGAVEEIAG